MRAAVVLMLALAAAPAPGATFTVTNANDSGAGSLRQAILDANGHSGVDDIAFSIAGSGVHQIVLQSKLPIITDPVTIDGFSPTAYVGLALSPRTGFGAYYPAAPGFPQEFAEAKFSNLTMQ